MRWRHAPPPGPALWLAALVVLYGALLTHGGGLAGAAEQGPVNVPRLLRHAGNTLLVASVAALLSIVWTFPAAYIFARIERGALRLVLGLLALLPLFIPPGVIAVCGVRLLSGTGLIIDGVYTVMGWEGMRPAPIFSLWGAALCLAWAYAPIAFLASTVAILAVGRHAEEATLMDAGAARMLLLGVLPAVLPGAMVGAVAVFLLAVVDFAVPDALRTQPVLSSQIYMQFGVHYETRGAAVSSLVLMAIGVAGAALLTARRGGVVSIEPRMIEDEALAPASRPIRRAWLVRLLGWACSAIPAVGAVGVLVLTTFGPQGFWPTISRTWISAREEFFFSLWLSAAGAVISAVFGTLLGAGLFRTRRPGMWRIVLLAAFLVPGPVAGVGLKILLLHGPGSLPLGLDDLLARLDDSPVPLLLAWCLRLAPLTALLVEYQLRRTPSELRDAARLDTRRAMRGFLLWGLRPALAGAAVGMAAAFAVTLGEAGAALLLIPPGTTTLSVRLMTLMHYAPSSEVSALCLLMTVPCLALVPITLLWRILRSPG